MLAHVAFVLSVLSIGVQAQRAPGSGADPPTPAGSALPGPWTPGSSGASLTGMGRTIHATSADDFCLLMPPDPTKENFVEAEADAVAYCLNASNQTRPMPDNFILAAHYRESPDFVTVSGTFDPYRMNINATENYADCGGEYDGHGAQGVGNPVGVGFKDPQFSQFFQFAGMCQEVDPATGVARPWGTFCLRLCRGANAFEYCNNRYDLLGCHYTAPGSSYTCTISQFRLTSSRCGFDDCRSDSGNQVGVYDVNGSKSTFSQGMSSTPSPPPGPATSQCTSVSSPATLGVTYPWANTATSVTGCVSTNDDPNPTAAVRTAAASSSGSTSAASQLPTTSISQSGASVFGPVFSLVCLALGFVFVL